MLVENILQKFPHGKVRYQEHGSDPRSYRVSFRKVKETLGFEPKCSIQNGIDELVNAIENHIFDYANVSNNFFGNYEINYRITT